MFIVALFTVAKTWKLPKCPSRWMQKEDVVHSIQWNIIQSLSSFQFSHSVMSASLQPQGLQHARLPCPSPTPGAWSNSSLLTWWCHPTILSSVIPFFSCLQSFPASGSFPMSHFFYCKWSILQKISNKYVYPKLILYINYTSIKH